MVWTDGAGLPLTYEDRRIVDDPRFAVVRHETREWNLQLTGITWHDRGAYICTVNTDPVRSKVVFLDVKGQCQGHVTFDAITVRGL